MKEKTETTIEVNRDTIPENETLIPVKFNKEIRNITIEEASNLAGKGMKFDAISKQWERLKGFAREDNSTTEQFLDALEKGRTEKRIEELTKECGGNSEIAKRIVRLEQKEEATLFGEKDFKEFFPNKEISELPQEVLLKAKENNSNLLDEYLRYSAKKHIEALREEEQKKENTKSSVGSQKDSGIFRSPENEQFIKGLWNK